MKGSIGATNRQFLSLIGKNKIIPKVKGATVIIVSTSKINIKRCCFIYGLIWFRSLLHWYTLNPNLTYSILVWFFCFSFDFLKKNKNKEWSKSFCLNSTNKEKPPLISVSRTLNLKKRVEGYCSVFESRLNQTEYIH